MDSHQRDINLLALAEVNLAPECMRCDALCGSRFRCNNIGRNGHSVQWREIERRAAGRYERAGSYRVRIVRYSKAVSEARRAALSAIRAEQIRDLERAQANARDLQRLVQSLEKLDQVDDWFQQRLVKLRAEAEARRDRHRAVAGRAVASMRERGQRFARIAAASATAEKTIRELARFAATGRSDDDRNASAPTNATEWPVPQAPAPAENPTLF